MIFSFYSSSFACLEPKLDRLDDWSIFVGIWAIRSVAQGSRQQADDVCDYFWLNLSQCYLWIFFLLQIEPSMMKIESQLKIIVSFIIKGGRVELKQFTNWWTVFTSLWKKTFSLYGEIFIHRNNSIHCKVKKLTSSPHGENNSDE